MADANWLRKAPPAPDLDDDPFAELTRIMGFDPRVPFRGVRQEEAPQQVVAAPKVEISDEDLDFSLDLENELIGALEPELEYATPAAGSEPWQAVSWAAVQSDPFPARAAATPVSQVPALDEEAYGAVEAATGEDESLASGDASGWDTDEAAFADYVAEDDEAADAFVQPEETLYAESPRYDDTGEEPAQAQDAADAGQNEASPYAAYRRDGDDDWQPDAPHADWNADAGVAAASGPETSPQAVEAEPGYFADRHDDTDNHDVALAAELDEVLSASFDGDAAYGDDWLADHEPEPETPRRSDEDMRPFAPLPVDHFATEFDEAMAEVDMDFTSTEPALPEATWRAPQHDLSPLEEEPTDLTADNAAVARQDADEATDDEEFLSEPQDDDVQGFAADASEAYAEDEPLEDIAAGSPVSNEPAGHGDGASRSDAYSVTQSEIDDAIAELAAIVRGYDQPKPAAYEAADEAEPESATADAVDVLDIDTVDVPEGAVALADDLDIPDIDYAEDGAPVFDDLDAELAAAFGEPAMETIQPAQPQSFAQQDFDLDGSYDRDTSGIDGYGVAALAGAAAAGTAGAYPAATLLRGRPGDVQFVRRDAAGAYAQDDFEVEADPELEDDLAAADATDVLRRSPARRGLVVASVVGGIAMVGVIGALAFSGGGTIGSGEPALVKADTDPVKVRPENPGGAVVANQTSGVFDRAAGEAPVQPEQQALISTEEEPVDVAARFPDPEPIDESADIEALAEAPAKSEDRIEPAAAEMTPAQEDTLAVPPRKVRTMIVKPDGTLVPREEVVTDQPATVGSTTAAGSLTDPAMSAPAARDEFSAAAGAPAAEVPTTAAADDVVVTAGTQSASAPAGAGSAMPDQVPVAPSRPADQPLDIVGEVKPGQVASLDPQAGAVPAGAWSMQIASQPTEAAAQASYKDLSRRYASVLGGRSANIVKAEIAGKGTFWRVRVPAGSRNEAVQLCESYKAAGGNCFVSK